MPAAGKRMQRNVSAPPLFWCLRCYLRSMHANIEWAWLLINSLAVALNDFSRKPLARDPNHRHHGSTLSATVVDASPIRTSHCDSGFICLKESHVEIVIHKRTLIPHQHFVGYIKGLDSPIALDPTFLLRWPQA